ncbi:MAG: hypothetical protein ACI865_001766 [Flavobacteriaceae bacterium]|jgi:hypothetical protein
MHLLNKNLDVIHCFVLSILGHKGSSSKETRKQDSNIIDYLNYSYLNSINRVLFTHHRLALPGTNNRQKIIRMKYRLPILFLSFSTWSYGQSISPGLKAILETVILKTKESSYYTSSVNSESLEG